MRTRTGNEEAANEPPMPQAQVLVEVFNNIDHSDTSRTDYKGYPLHVRDDAT